MSFEFGIIGHISRCGIIGSSWDKHYTTLSRIRNKQYETSYQFSRLMFIWFECESDSLCVTENGVRVDRKTDWLMLFREWVVFIIVTVLVNTAVFCYKNNICLYKMLHVSTLKGLHQAWMNKKEGSRISWIVIRMKEVCFWQLYLLQLCYCIKIKFVVIRIYKPSFVCIICFLGTFAKLRKAIISFVVCLSAWNNSLRLDGF
jgi:hypothetical protein